MQSRAFLYGVVFAPWSLCLTPFEREAIGNGDFHRSLSFLRSLGLGGFFGGLDRCKMYTHTPPWDSARKTTEMQGEPERGLLSQVWVTGTRCEQTAEAAAGLQPAHTHC